MKFILILPLLISCSSFVGKEYNYSGGDSLVYKTSNQVRNCGKNGCYLHYKTEVVVSNIDMLSQEIRVGCKYFWGSYEYGSVKSKFFSLAPNKSRKVTFYYSVNFYSSATPIINTTCFIIY